MTEAVAEPAAPRQASWSVGWPALAFVCGLVGSVVLALPLLVIDDDPERSLPLVVATMVGLWIGYGAVIAFTLAKRNANWSRDLGFAFARSELVIGAGAGLGSWIGTGALYALLDAAGLIDLDSIDNPAKELADLAHGASFAVLVLFIAVGAPIFEELFFRGFLQRPLVRNLGALPGVTVGGLIFGISHFQPVQTIGLVAFGWVLGALAHSTGRLGASIVAHMVFNGSTMVVLFLSRGAPG